MPLFDTLSLLKSEVASVRHRVESYETWGVANSFSPIDDKVAATVLEGLSTLTDFCYCAPRALAGAALDESVFDLALLAADRLVLIELEPTEHPLAVEQRVGISRARLAEIARVARESRPR